MKLKVSVLRNVISEALMNEAFGNMKLVELPIDSKYTSWALTKNDNVIGGMTIHNVQNGWQVVDTLWADSAPGAYALLMSVLANTEGLVPSKKVSPAAQNVIKRWWDKNRFDAGLVVEDPLDNPDNVDQYLKAGYLPGDGVKPIADKVDVKKDTPRFDELLQAVVGGFVKNYTDNARTKIKRSGPVSEAIDTDADDFNDAVDELMKEPFTKTVEAFAEHKYEEDEETYGTLELQALARNLYLKDTNVKKSSLATAPATYRDRVKSELSSYGLTFSPRAKVKQHRGFSDPFHGSNRFAGNHGGSGFENAFNRTPSAKRDFDVNDPTALGMGSKQRKP